MKSLRFLLFINLFYNTFFSFSQNWKVNVKSQVELRTWKLTSKAESQEKPLAGAIIKLLRGTELIAQVNSNGNGDFNIDVPPNGEFIIEVSYPGCNSKRFFISTNNVPKELNEDKYMPSFGIGGFVLSKPYPGIDYSELNTPLIKIQYQPKSKNFDDDDDYSQQGLGIVARIQEQENQLFQKFCIQNKNGDAALAKGDCPLAKSCYEKALAVLSGENYPAEQIKKADKCIKEKEDAAQKAKEEAEKKAEAERLAKEKAAQLAAEKAEADRIAREKAESEKAERLKLAKEQEAIKKAEAEKKAKEKAEAEKIAKQKNKDFEKEKVTKVEPKKPEKTPEEIKPIATDEPHEDNSGKPGSGKTKVRQTLGGSAEMYKQNIDKAEGYFKMKRYTEAKSAYQEALKYKANDPLATKRLTEIQNLQQSK